MLAVTSHYAFAHTVLPWFLLNAEDGRAERFESLRHDGGERVLLELFERGLRDGVGAAPLASIKPEEIVLRRETLSGLPVILFEFPGPKHPGESFHAAAVLRRSEAVGGSSVKNPALSFFALDAPPVPGDPVLREAVREGDGLAWRRLRIAPAHDLVTFRALLIEEAARLAEIVSAPAAELRREAARANCPPLLATVCEYFERWGHRYAFSGDGRALLFGFTREHVESHHVLHCDAARDRLLATACPGIEIPAERRPAAAELLARINDSASLGGFELDFNNGVLRYRIALSGSGRPVTELLLRDLVERAADNLNAAWPAIADVIAGRLTPGEAFGRMAGAGPAPADAAPVAADRAAGLRDRMVAWLDAKRLNYWIEKPSGFLGLNFKGNHGSWTTMIDYREASGRIVARATAALDVTPRTRAGAVELATRLNDRLALGHFDVDVDGGKIRARFGSRVDGAALTDSLIETFVYSAGDLLDRYLPAIRDVVEVEAAPALALARVEPPAG